MNSEEMFVKHNDKEFLKFDRIPKSEQLHSDEKICGFMYLYNLLKEKESLSMDGQHDVIYLNNVDDFELKECNIIYLLRCGISYNENDGYLYMFT